MKNQEVRILLDDKKTVIVVESQDQIVEHVKNKNVHSITIYGDMPSIDIDDAWGGLHFSHSGADFFLMPEGSQGSFDFQVYEKFMFSMRDNYKWGLTDNFAVVLGFPYINDDDLLAMDPHCVHFMELGPSGKITDVKKKIHSGLFEEGIEETYDDYDYH